MIKLNGWERLWLVGAGFSLLGFNLFLSLTYSNPDYMFGVIFILICSCLSYIFGYLIWWITQGFPSRAKLLEVDFSFKRRKYLYLLVIFIACSVGLYSFYENQAYDAHQIMLQNKQLSWQMERHHQEKIELEKQLIELDRKSNLEEKEERRRSMMEEDEERRRANFYRHFQMTK